MKNIRKIIIAVTLFLFVGQSFASLKMACEISSGSSHQSNAAQQLESSHPEHSKMSVNDDPLESMSREVSFQQIDAMAGCDTDQTTCACSMGTCSVFYLPVNNYSLDFTKSLDQQIVREDFSSYQPSLPYRPPIFV